MLWTVRELASTQTEPVVVELTVEIANTQQASGLETVGQRVNNAVVVCRKHYQSELFVSPVSLVELYLPGIIDKL